MCLGSSRFSKHDFNSLFISYYGLFYQSGYYIPSGTTVYYACATGYYAPYGATSCTLSDIGTYSPLVAMTSPWSCSGSSLRGAFYCNFGRCCSIRSQRIFELLLIFDLSWSILFSKGTGINTCVPGTYFTGSSGCVNVPAGQNHTATIGKLFGNLLWCLFLQGTTTRIRQVARTILVLLVPSRLWEHQCALLVPPARIPCSSEQRFAAFAYLH